MNKTLQAPHLTSPLQGEGHEPPPPARGRPGGGPALKFRELSPVTVERSRTLRKTMTDAEKKLWHHLKLRQINDTKFRRQHPIEPYIVDFVCIQYKIVIELDGGQHAWQQPYDIKRDAYIKQKGYRVLRFWNNDVMHNIDGVLEVIARTIRDPHLTSPLQGEEYVESLPPARGKTDGGPVPHSPPCAEQQ